MSIYVEILVRAPMDALWAHTQTPELHQQWDLRFSQIDFLPRTADNAPQRFRYITRLGFGLAVTGEGETVGQRDLPDGSRSSALKFGSDAPLSLIHEGSGYWKYIPTSQGTLFLTSYDYRTRFGLGGTVVDRLIFRPLLGWATAFSFDRLRIWVEHGVSPASSLRQALIRLITRVALLAIVVHQALLGAGLNPFLLSVAVSSLSAIDRLVLPGIASAARCRRRPRRHHDVNLRTRARVRLPASASSDPAEIRICERPSHRVHRSGCHG